MKIDEKELRIIDILKENARLSTHKISKKTGIPVTTVYNRIKKLNKEGIIKGYTITLDHKKLGFPITAYVLMHYNLEHWQKNPQEARDNLKKAMSKLPFIHEIKYITGNFDIMLKVRLKDMGQLNTVLLDKLRHIAGIGNTETIFVIEDVK